MKKISVIALEVGYSNYRYFIKVFKQYTHMLPSDFMDYFHS
ncbi:AraC family transcriptional regulator [Virgibacillus halophilus]|uniref:AraC family transcriptional regulator n=1 Tax=Tigheibacillus halophilus TaxID=361280 RepID=A0ABU5C3H3_9BACI|nr:AraC family transcriptional regulator [Virgibacillus halophilus]